MFNKLLKWLRSLGAVGDFLANILTFVFPGLTMSALVTAFFAYCTSAIEWAQQPRIYTTAGIFLLILWTYIGVVVLRSKKVPQTVKIAHEYAYGLINDGGWQPKLGKFPSDHPKYPNEDAINIICNIRNTSTGPIHIKVEDTKVVIDDRTYDDTANNIVELNLARFATRGIICAGIKRDVSRTLHSGTASFRILYGPYDGDFIRRYSLKMKIHIGFDPTGQMMGTTDELMEETDEPFYVARKISQS